MDWVCGEILEERGAVERCASKVKATLCLTVYSSRLT